MKARAPAARMPETADVLIVAVVFLLALAVRLAALAAAPLSEREAAEAWGALNLLRGRPDTSVSALYSTVTAGLLFLAGPSRWAPRVLPALAGSLVVFLPLLLRRSRGRLESLLACALLALSPTLWIAGTVAGGAALGFLAAGVCILYLRNRGDPTLPAGIALGVALAAGPLAWSGLLIAVLAALVEWFFRAGSLPETAIRPANPLRSLAGGFALEPMFAGGALIGLAAGGTGLFFLPRGLSALGEGLSAWAGAFLSGGPRLGELILMLAGYEPLALIFGLAGIVLLLRGVLSEENRFWLAFAAVAAAWVLLRPAAFPEEGLWLILPLVLLAAAALRSVVEAFARAERPELAAVQTAAVLGLLAFTALELGTYVATGSWLPLLLAPVGVFGGILLGPLLAENLERDWARSLVGLGAAWALALAAAQIGTAWNATQTRRNSPNELWRSGVVQTDLARLQAVMAQISEWQTGARDELEVVVEGPEQSALGWELLAYANVQYVDALDPLATPAMVITPYRETADGVDSPQLTAVYKGQGFAFVERRAWSGWPPDLIGWLLYRSGPTELGRIILWVRGDLLVPAPAAES
jgi:hypothetical protein